MKTVSVIGLGNRGSEYMGFLKAFHSKKVSIFAICDISKQALIDIAPKFGVPESRCYNDTESFFSKGVMSDALIIATQDASHYEIAKKALETGYKYILLEKPVSGVKDEYTELRDLAKEKGALLLVCHVLRYSNYYKKIKEIISSGKIGEIVEAKMEQVKASGSFAVAMDIDAAGLPFLKGMNPPAGAKSVEQLSEIAKMAGKPFIVKVS